MKKFTERQRKKMLNVASNNFKDDKKTPANDTYSFHDIHKCLPITRSYWLGLQIDLKFQALCRPEFEDG